MSPVALAHCEDVRLETGNVKVFTLRVQEAPSGFLGQLRAGRYVAIHYPDSCGVPQRRLYTITKKREPAHIEIAVKRSNDNGVSAQMHATLQAGSLVPLEYVAGDISVESVSGLQRLGMVAGGIGITLPVALLRALANRARNGQPVPDTVLILCIPNVADIPFLHELLTLALTSAWFTLRVFVTRERVHACDHFRSGRPDADALRIMGQPQGVVICGSHSFAHAMREHATLLFPSARLLVESFTSPSAQPRVQMQPTDSPLRLRLGDRDHMIETTPGKSLLDMLEACRIPVRSQCRSGICGNCRIRVSGGQCRHEPDFCLTDDDRRRGYALACCTYPLSGEVSVELTTVA